MNPPYITVATSPSGIMNSSNRQPNNRGDVMRILNHAKLIKELTRSFSHPTLNVMGIARVVAKGWYTPSHFMPVGTTKVSSANGQIWIALLLFRRIFKNRLI